MALPVGVTTATLAWGPLGDYLGVPFTAATVTVWAAGDIVWSATGQPLLRSPLVVQGVSGSIVLPTTGQPGFIAGGAVITGWTYTARIESPGQVDRTVVFTLPVAGSTVDLDTLIPATAESAGAVVTVPVVTSVQGRIGAVIITAADAAALPSEAPAVLKNTAAAAIPFRVRNAADTADILTLNSTGGAVFAGTLSGNIIGAPFNSMEAVQLQGASGGLRFGPTAGQTFIQRGGTQILISDSYLRSRVLTTVSRITAAAAGAGSFYYDTTLGKPVWSDGTNWRDAAGTIV